MATIRFVCSDCGTRLKASTADAGAAVDCPNCGASVTIPDEPEETPTVVEEVTEVSETDETEKPTAQIKAPWEYAKEWSRVRFALLLCAIAAGLTIAELASGEITDRLYRRGYTAVELYFGLTIGLLIGAFRIYAKVGFRHVPRQWGPRPLLWVCVGVEAALLIVVTVTAIILAATPPPAEETGPDPPAEVMEAIPPSEREAFRREFRRQYQKTMQKVKDLHTGTPVERDPLQRDPRVRVVSIGFGLATLLAGLISLLWPMYLKELAGSIKDQDAWDLGDRVLDILGPAFLLWVLSVSIYQFLASVTEVSGVYRPFGKTVTVFGLLTIQCVLIRAYWRLRKSLRAKSRLRKPKAKPTIRERA